MMGRTLRWALLLAGGLLVTASGFIFGIYVCSALILHRHYEAPFSPIELPTDSAGLVQGERLARIRGCFGGCHGSRLEGRVFFDAPGVGRLVAPDLTAAAQRWNNAELARVVRRGIRPDGHAVFGMPSAAFRGLSDEDLGAILAFLRHAPPEHGLAPEHELRILGRIALVSGRYFSEPARIGRDTASPPGLTPREPRVAFGRYLATTICSECHGLTLHGSARAGTPDLRVVGGYSLPAFTLLLREGKPPGGRQPGTMSQLARQRFRYLSEAEVTALFAYLHCPDAPCPDTLGDASARDSRNRRTALPIARPRRRR